MRILWKKEKSVVGKKGYMEKVDGRRLTWKKHRGMKASGEGERQMVERRDNLQKVKGKGKF